MEKTIDVGGIQYTARRRTNLSEVNYRYFKRLIGLFYEGLADDIGADKEQVATALVDFANISADTIGGAVLLKRNDTPEVIQQKCIAWLNDSDLFVLGNTLIELVNTVNTVQPDTALAPDSLPETADPKA